MGQGHVATRTAVHSFASHGGGHKRDSGFSYKVHGKKFGNVFLKNGSTGSDQLVVM